MELEEETRKTRKIISKLFETEKLAKSYCKKIEEKEIARCPYVEKSSVNECYYVVLSEVPEYKKKDAVNYFYSKGVFCGVQVA